MNNIRGDIAGSKLTREIKSLNSLSKINPSIISKNVLKNSKNREARLICNLFRIKTLMKLMGLDEDNINQINVLSKKLIDEKWPSMFSEDLEHFLAQFLKLYIKRD